MNICGRGVITLTKLKACMLFAVLTTLMVTGTLVFRLELVKSVYKFGIPGFMRSNNGTFKALIGSNDSTSQKCMPPLLDPFNKDFLPSYSSPNPLDCTKLYNSDSPFSGVVFEVKNGNKLYQLKNLGGLSCCYTPFFRTGDNSVRLASTCHPITVNLTIIPSDMDYIQLLCKDRRNKVTYKDAFAIVHEKSGKIPVSGREYLNIEIIGLDSVSHLNFIRQMPLSRKYLLDSLNAVSLNGYSVIGTGTLPNVLPMLTGLSLSDFTSSCANRFSFLNSCPFIWKDFSSQGYLTTFAEDWSQLNDFWAGFQSPPTDYYFRPYSVFVGKLVSTFANYKGKIVPITKPEDLCFGTRHQFQTLLDFVQEVRHVATRLKRPHFQFAWNGMMAHNNMNNLGLGDIPLLMYLKKYKESGSWNNTIVIIIGDHGHHGIGSEYRFTTNGNIEMRLPVAYITFPPWFQTRFPKEHKHLTENSNKVTAAYDIFKTIDHLRNLATPAERKRNGRGISLLEHIPENRTCLEAGITLEECHPCHPRIPIDTKGVLVTFVSNFIIKVLNSKQQPGSLCSTQSLRSIKSATKWDPRDIKREVCSAEGQKGFEILNGVWTLIREKISIVCKEDQSFDIVTLRLTTEPLGSEYFGEVMTVYEKNQSVSFNVKKIWLTDDLQRIDRYAETGKCVSRPHKPFCICKT